jgi:hypothetical protein
LYPTSQSGEMTPKSRDLAHMSIRVAYCTSSSRRKCTKGVSTKDPKEMVKLL